MPYFTAKVCCLEICASMVKCGLLTTMFIHVRKKVSNFDSGSGEKGQNLCFMFYTALFGILLPLSDFFLNMIFLLN